MGAAKQSVRISAWDAAQVRMWAREGVWFSHRGQEHWPSSGDRRKGALGSKLWSNLLV